AFWFINQDPNADYDADGLTNLQEYQRGTDPTKPDIDGDGMLDGADSQPLISTFGIDSVWVEDSVPSGATTYSVNDAWRWLGGVPPLSVSGSSNHVSKAAYGLHEHGFRNANAPMLISAGDKLVAYLYLYPNNLPREVMLQWVTTDGATNRAYWGGDFVVTGPRLAMGSLPKAGCWVCLEVSAASLGLEGKQVNGMAFTLYDGWAAWDHAGKIAVDSDGDGLPDDWERRFFGDLTQSGGNDDDYDMDGLS